MSLGFGTPALLAGMAAALLPLLVHLLRRRPPAPTLFPAFLLLAGPARRHARRRRLRELLLLVTRMALLALVAFTLAGPYRTRAVSVPPTATRHQAAVILVDDTLSMRFRRDGRPLIEEARRRARALLDVLPPTAPAALLTVSDHGAQVRELGVDRAPLRRALERLEATHLAASGGEALSRALRVLASAPVGAPRSIYFLTDLTRTGLSLPPGLVPGDTALQVIDVAQGALPNRAVVAFGPLGDLAGARRGGASVGAAAPGAPGAPGAAAAPGAPGAAAAPGAPGAAAAPGAPGASLRFRVSLRNATDREEGMRVRLLADGRELARSFFVVPPHQTSPVELAVPAAALPESVRFVEAVLGASDGLAEDDRRFLPLGRGPGTRLLLVDGDPRETRHEDELFYLEAALGALAAQEPLRVRVVAAGDLEGATLEEEDLVVLANVAAPSQAALAVLGAFVRRGGALLVALGDQVDPEAYNETLGVSLLPAQLRAIRSGGVAGPEGPPARVDPEQLAPALRFALEDPESRRALRAARVQRYGLLEGLRGEVLLRLDTGAPLLMSRALGAGRVLLFTTTLDRDWSDLALRPAFLPLLRGLLSYLTGQGLAGASVVPVGRPVTLRALPGEQLLVRTPGGAYRPLEPAGPDGIVPFFDTGAPGPYQVFVSPLGRTQATARPRRPGSGRGVPALAGPALAGPALAGPALAGPAFAGSVFAGPAFAGHLFAGLASTSIVTSLVAATPPSGLRERPALAFAVVTDPAESDLRRLLRAPGQPGLLGSAPAGSGPLSKAQVREDLVAYFALLCLLLLVLESLLAARYSRWRSGSRGGGKGEA